MPLKFDNVVSETGVTFNDCYGVVTQYTGDMTSLSITIAIFTNKECYDTDKIPIRQEIITLVISELAKSNIFSYIYDAVVNSLAVAKHNPSIIEYPFTGQPTLYDPAVAGD